MLTYKKEHVILSELVCANIHIYDLNLRRNDVYLYILVSIILTLLFSLAATQQFASMQVLFIFLQPSLFYLKSFITKPISSTQLQNG